MNNYSLTNSDAIRLDANGKLKKNAYKFVIKTKANHENVIDKNCVYKHMLVIMKEH